MSFKNIIQRKYKERQQESTRVSYGALEKPNQYKKRAKIIKQNKQKLKDLLKLAKDKNPDEFYFHMINSRVKVYIYNNKNRLLLISY